MMSLDSPVFTLLATVQLHSHKLHVVHYPVLRQRLDIVQLLCVVRFCKGSVLFFLQGIARFTFTMVVSDPGKIQPNKPSILSTIHIFDNGCETHCAVRFLSQQAGEGPNENRTLYQAYSVLRSSVSLFLPLNPRLSYSIPLSPNTMLVHTYILPEHRNITEQWYCAYLPAPHWVPAGHTGIGLLKRISLKNVMYIFYKNQVSRWSIKKIWIAKSYTNNSQRTCITEPGWPKTATAAARPKRHVTAIFGVASIQTKAFI